ncbi:prolyl oligopeptidase family serine peptidase [Flavobacterium sp. N1719]|uniref:carboxylesterase family protein n=1 Tax=Flavobacterium sp. N1719 TaxID=2885633 RepID=UPI0022223638|nr:prolyl oligopeptidase family serine peptidase [Flavobacterium sp. N1719]
MKKLSVLLLVFFGFTSFAQETKALFEEKITKKVTMGYVLQLPENTKEKYPLIVFLHGSGERGTDLELVKAHSPFTYQNLIKEPFAILAPQCPEGIWWDTEVVYELIKKTIAKNNIDPSRVYLTGLSMGGWGTWKLALEHPELFAAVAPVCAPVDRMMLFTAEKLKSKPIRIFHGALDDVVTPDNSIEMFQKLKGIGANVELTIFSNDNHNSWDSTYSNPEFYTWLFQQHQ